MLNKVVLIGRLTQDPELRYVNNDTPVCDFSLAVERPFTNRNGERDVDFIDITTWRNQAETCGEHLGKGRMVAVDGRLQVRKYEDRDGNRRVSYDVIANNVQFLDWPSNNGNGNGRSQNQQANTEANNTSSGNGGIAQDFDEDDVPF